MRKLLPMLLAMFALVGGTAAHAALVIVDYELETTNGTVIGSGQFSYDDTDIPTDYYGFTTLTFMQGGTKLNATAYLNLIRTNPGSKDAKRAAKEFEKYLASLAKLGGDTLFIRDRSTGALLGDLSRKGQVTLQNLPTVAVSVPEPGTWLLTMLGFAAAGAGLRRRRSQTVRVRTYNGKPLPNEA